jgi:hypothetical protein
MDKVFKVVDGEAKLIREELELIPEFATMLSLKYNKQEGDIDGRKRTRATREFTYLWFMYSNYSPYREYDDEERRQESLIVSSLPADFKEGEELKLAVLAYKKLNETRILKLIKAAERAIDNLRKYFETVDFTERNNAGTLVNKPSEIIKAISDLDDVAEGLNKLANRQKNENNEFISARGSKQAGWLMENEKLKADGANKNRDAEED